MNVIEELQAQITATQEHLAAAVENGQQYEAARHRARLEDLIDMAGRHAGLPKIMSTRALESGG
jgi:hypothetical protein